MATQKNKYDHLFISGVDPKIQATRPYATIGFLDGKTFEGCQEYMVFWIGEKPYGAYGTKAWGEIYHGPHEHKNPEIYMHLGTDPENPWDLGAEVEMYMGPEMEKHIITRSTIICLPAGFPHSPWRILKVTRPFIIVTAIQNTVHTEKARKDLVPDEALRKRMIFINSGYEDEGIKPSMDIPEIAGPQAKYK